MPTKNKKLRKKDKVLNELFRYCQKKNNPVFDNRLVKTVSKKFGFVNPFDATKLDNKNKLSILLLHNNVAIIHLGKGRHRFIKGIDKVFHDFEPIQTIIDWPYKKSVLNQFNSSESNILSVTNNQRILHHFVFETDREFEDTDISKRPKTYFPHRTKTSFKYNFGQAIEQQFDGIQIEIDLTIEFKGIIGLFEAKNGIPGNFSVYQIYHPFLYYHNARQRPEIADKIRKIICTYVVRNSTKGIDTISLWAYTFKNPLDITSIDFIKSSAYRLINQKEKV